MTRLGLHILIVAWHDQALGYDAFHFQILVRLLRLSFFCPVHDEHSVSAACHCFVHVRLVSLILGVSQHQTRIHALRRDGGSEGRWVKGSLILFEAYFLYTTLLFLTFRPSEQASSWKLLPTKPVDHPQLLKGSLRTLILRSSL